MKKSANYKICASFGILLLTGFISLAGCGDIESAVNETSSTSGSSGTSGSSSGTSGNSSNCASQYTGSTSDPQLDGYCQQAAYDQCLHESTGQTTYDHEGTVACQILASVVSQLGATYSCSYCPYKYPN